MRHIRELREDAAGLQAQLNKDRRPSGKTTDTDKLGRRVALHIAIRDTFNEGELRLLAAEVGANYADLEGDTHSERCLSLALLMQRHGRFGEFLKVLASERPHVDWLAFV